MNKTITDTSKELGLKRDDVVEFLRLRGYIMRDNHRRPSRKGEFIGTVLGLDKGYVVNYQYSNEKITCTHVLLTEKGFQKVQKAFFVDKPAQAEKARIDAICKEYERKMKPFSCGKAE